MTAQRVPSWYNRIKNTLSENIPVVIATATSVIAVGMMLKASNDADESARRNQTVLDNIEEKIQIAMEVPSIVRVEIGDNFEVIGHGNRTD
jgi:hypothetical protein